MTDYISICGRHQKSPMGGNTYVSVTVRKGGAYVYNKSLNVNVYDREYIYNSILGYKERFDIDTIKVRKTPNTCNIEKILDVLELFI